MYDTFCLKLLTWCQNCVARNRQLTRSSSSVARLEKLSYFEQTVPR